MFIYNIITTIDTGSLEILTYFSNQTLKHGQVVRVMVRNKAFLGINITQNSDQSEQKRGVGADNADFKIKEITEVLPLIISKNLLDLILKTHAFSWNKLSSIVSAVLQPFSYLEKKLNQIANTDFNGLIDLNFEDLDSAKSDPDFKEATTLIQTSQSQKNPSFETYYESDIVFRIMYLIRNEMENSSNSNIPELPKNLGQILILFPDTATLESLSKSIELSLESLSKEYDHKFILNTYTSSGSIVTNRRTVLNCILSQTTQIILTTRSGIFLPFTKLTKAILIEESNNNLIQDQNSLYFDARDISYILSQIWGCDLNWISHFPSSRSLAYKKLPIDVNSNTSEVSLSRHSQIESISSSKQSIAKHSTIQIHEKNNSVDSNHLFSSATETEIEVATGPVLFIHPRRGNFRITQCGSCRHIWHCPNCTAALITYKNAEFADKNKLELICHHCQTKVEYPSKCPECSATDISSYSSGIDDLIEHLQKTYLEKVIFKIETGNKKQFQEFQNSIGSEAQNTDESPFYLTSKVFDPRIPYGRFQTIVIIQAQNLATGIDYLTTEEVFLSIYNLYFALGRSPTRLIFDTTSPELEILQKLALLNQTNHDFEAIIKLFEEFMTTELAVRKTFHLPPYQNLLLLSLSGKDHTKLKSNIVTFYKWLKESTIDLQPDLELVAPYPAKMLKRQGMFTYHLLLKYPKNFKHLKTLEKILKPKIADMHMQARLNPRHVF